MAEELGTRDVLEQVDARLNKIGLYPGFSTVKL